jgi:hypothetical protein
MEQHREGQSIEERLARLERRLRLFQVICAVSVATLAAYMLRPSQVSHAAQSESSGGVVRARGLIIEDIQGRPRILLGAPIPKVTGRKRQEEATGLILVGENGADRLALAASPPAPQFQGKPSTRMGSAAGLIVNDPEGNERGGMGVIDSDGRVLFCGDYSVGHEAICMGVVSDIPSLTLRDPAGNASDRLQLAVLQDGSSLLKFADTAGQERAKLVVNDHAAAQFLVSDPKSKTKRDVFARPKR